MGGRLSAARYRKRISLRDVAREIGVTPGSVDKWERGSIPTPDKRDALAVLLGVKESKVWAEFFAALNARVALLDS
jgi:transcriptional regulator with XRE-family HTH domain